MYWWKLVACHSACDGPWLGTPFTLELNIFTFVALPYLWLPQFTHCSVNCPLYYIYQCPSSWFSRVDQWCSRCVKTTIWHVNVNVITDRHIATQLVDALTRFRCTFTSIYFSEAKSGGHSEYFWKVCIKLPHGTPVPSPLAEQLSVSWSCCCKCSELRSCCTSRQCLEWNKAASQKLLNTLWQSSPLTNNDDSVRSILFLLMTFLTCSYNFQMCICSWKLVQL